VEKFGNCNLGDWKKNIDVNLIGTANMVYYALPLLFKSRKGKIINFAGGGSAYGRMNHTAYASSKSAVVRFSECLAMEYPEFDINAIAPGAYKTKMWKDEKYDKEPENWGDMDRLKAFVDFLCSEKSDGITGRFIHYKDNWESFEVKNMAREMFTLRRVEK
jgi:2-deoxy-D-gluconate 3-dehydrogenase